MPEGPSIRILGGVGTIGGTKILVQEDDYRVIFDFGITYAAGGEFWGGAIQPRPAAGGLRDYITMGDLPRCEGLYRADAVQSVGLTPNQGDERTHLFISHLHLDHMRLLDMVADEIPVWMHADSLRLFRAVAETGHEPAVPLGARPFEWGQTVRVGPIRVSPVAVDHDIPGACGLIIETSAGSLVYTGDFRTHGVHPERTARFFSMARETRPRVLLTEGTRLGEAERSPDRPPPRSESEVASMIAQVRVDCPGLALITLYPRNIERLMAIAAELSGVGRRLALAPEAAHLFAEMGGRLDQISLYWRQRDRHLAKSHASGTWHRRLLESGIDVVEATDVRKDPLRYLVQLFMPDINELVDLSPPPGSIFLHSNGEPLGRFDPSFGLWARWLNHFGLELRYAGSSGHATPKALNDLVRAVSPDVLMPIHSLQPELLDVADQRRILPEQGACYDLATLQQR